MKRTILAFAMAGVLWGCAGSSPEAETTTEPVLAGAEEADPAAAELSPASDPSLPSGRVEIRPGLFVDRGARTVEFEGFVPIDAHDSETPIVYLETIVCAVDSKEHESLVATSVRPSDVHAALLLIGLAPGAPGSWAWDGAEMTTVAPTGPSVRVELLVGGEAFAPESWITADPAASDRRAFDSEGFVFAGSYFKPVGGGERYEADADGVIVGLHTFGSEVVAQERVMSHDSGVSEPEWIASPETPVYGTPVLVRISAE